MLIELRIRDFAVIDDLSLQLGPGLNALTGETGAGKSIIVGALSLLLGERASSEDVRVGAERAVVEGVFDVSGRTELVERLEGLGFAAEDGLLILRREVQAAGRNRSWINGSPATAGSVGAVGSAMVDLHGQHEHQTLLRSDAQRDILDAWAGCREQAADVRRLHRGWRAAVKALDERMERARDVASQEDFMRFQLREILDARLEPDEEAELEARARRLEHARELGEGTEGLHQALYGSDDALADQLADALTRLKTLARMDSELARSVELVEAAYHQIVEAGQTLAAYADGVEQDPAALDEALRRQELIFRLKRKYGPELRDVIETGERLEREVAELDRSEHDLEALERAAHEARSRLDSASEQLTARRHEAATRFAGEVERLLPSLGMEQAVFRCELLARPEPGPGGVEDIEFRVSLNPGFDPKPLDRVASGGELSRIMLALKALLAQVDQVPTLVFDEIDAGIGGVVAAGVARELERVAEHHQVFVITHLPQLASRAAAHLQVEKVARDGLAATNVVRLERHERVREIARMLGGDPESAASLEHARELLGMGRATPG